MDQNQFSRRFEQLYSQVYQRGMRRIVNKTHRISPETLALLQHLAIMGPSSLGQLAQHLARAPSTTSEMVGHLILKGMLEKEVDPTDARKNLIWLSEAGQKAALEANEVLDSEILAEAARELSDHERKTLVTLLEKFTASIKEK